MRMRRIYVADADSAGLRHYEACYLPLCPLRKGFSEARKGIVKQSREMESGSGGSSTPEGGGEVVKESGPMAYVLTSIHARWERQSRIRKRAMC